VRHAVYYKLDAVGYRYRIAYSDAPITAQATLDGRPIPDVPFTDLPVSWGSHQLVVSRLGYRKEQASFYAVGLKRACVPITLYPDAPEWSEVVFQAKEDERGEQVIMLFGVVIGWLLALRGIVAITERHFMSGFWWTVLGLAQCGITWIVALAVLEYLGLYACLVCLLGVGLLFVRIIGVAYLAKLVRRSDRQTAS
jgi:hypothetical protein